MKRLKQYYELLLDISLKIIHNCSNNEDVEEKNLIDSLEIVSPIIFDLKSKFENIVHEEFKFTDYELSILKL